VAFIYIYIFHIAGTGKNPTQEYEAQMEDARIEKEKFDAVNKDKVDEKNVPMADAAGLNRGMQIFKTDCFPCHGQLGEGGAGPNLTDDYWLHKGSLNDIFHSIKVGYPDKGMQSWLVKYNEKQISEIASYVKKMHGTNPPNAKTPQGDEYVDVAVAIDSGVLKKVDSMALIKK
jgi:cytochrome c oxidase cbb3-type subunit 3